MNAAADIAGPAITWETAGSGAAKTMGLRSCTGSCSTSKDLLAGTGAGACLRGDGLLTVAAVETFPSGAAVAFAGPLGDLPGSPVKKRFFIPILSKTVVLKLPT